MVRRMGTPARPDLHFDSVDAMLADVEHLRRGYDKAGQWDLGMVLDHLAKSMSPPFAAGQKNLPWPVPSIARVMIAAMARRKTYPMGVTIPALPSIRPTPGVDVDAAYDHFRDIAGKVKTLPADVTPFPPVGRVPTGDFLGLQLLHAAHHLSFLRPTT